MATVSTFSWFKLQGGARATVVTSAGDIVLRCRAPADRVVYYVLEQRFAMDQMGSKHVMQEYQGHVLKTMRKRDVRFAFMLESEEPAQVFSTDKQGGLFVHPEFIRPVLVGWQWLPLDVKKIVWEYAAMTPEVCTVSKEWALHIPPLRKMPLLAAAKALTNEKQKSLAMNTLMAYIYNRCLDDLIFRNKSDTVLIYGENRGFREELHSCQGFASSVDRFLTVQVAGKRLLELNQNDQLYLGPVIFDYISTSKNYDHFGFRHELFTPAAVPCKHPSCILANMFKQVKEDRSLNTILTFILSSFTADPEVILLSSRYCYELYEHLGEGSDSDE